jgi:hypothetical protein
MEMFDGSIFLIEFILAATMQCAYAAPLNVRDQNNITALPGAPFYPVSVQVSATAIAILSAIFVTFTHALLITRSARMTTTSKYPLDIIAKNISTLLTDNWPDEFDLPRPTENDGALPHSALQLFYMGKLVFDHSEKREPRGVLQTSATPDHKFESPQAWLTSGSPLTTSIFQIMVWEWVSMWLNILMIISTLLFNGLLTDTPSVDTWPRMVVVFIYTGAYWIHNYFTWGAFTNFVSNVASGATWSMLNRASFAIVDSKEIHEAGNNDPCIDFRVIEKASTEFTSGIYDVDLATAVQKRQATGNYQPSETNSASSSTPNAQPKEALHSPNELKDAIATVKKVQNKAREEATLAIAKALESVLANVMVMLGINIASGFTVWISGAATDQDSQLGSLTLLATISLGVAAMYNSVVQMNLLNSNYSEIVYLKEILINNQALEHVQKRRQPNYGRIGFLYGPSTPAQLRFWKLLRLVHLRNAAAVFLFGPVYVLLPTKNEHGRDSTSVDFQMIVSVRNSSVVFTTDTTREHKRIGNNNVEAINVGILCASLTA